jgi:hypothetical protein
MDPAMWQFLEVLRPDAVIDYVGVDQALATEIKERLDAVVIAEAVLNFDEPGVHSLVAIPPDSLRARALLEAHTNAPLAQKTAVGELQPKAELEELWAATGATRRTVTDAQDLLDAQLDVPSPLWVTKQHVRTFRRRLIGAPVIVYTESSPTLSRLIAFWNVRALTIGTDTTVLWLPLESIRSPGIGERLRALCLNKTQTNPDLLLLGKDESELDQAGRDLGFALDTSGKASVTFGSGTRDLTTKPLTFWRRIDPRGFLMEDRLEGTRVPVAVTVTSPVTALQVQSPILFNASIGGKIRIDIDGIEAIRWPRRAPVAKLIHPSANWSDAGLGFVTSPAASFKFDLNVPVPEVVIEACLRELGWTWSVSDKGRYARALLGAVAGRAAIDALRDRLVLRIVRDLTSLTSHKASQLLRSTLPASVTQGQINAAVATVVPSLVPQWKTASEIASSISGAGTTTSKAAVVVALTKMLRDRLATRAFRVRCANCGLITHIPMRLADDTVVCDGCTKVSTLIGPSGEPEMVYGLNSLVDRAADQDCLGHLPVQQWITSTHGLVWSVPGANLSHDSGTKREIDVLGLSSDAVIVAEVKNSAGGFTDPVATSTAQLATDLGATHVVLAAMDDWGSVQRHEIEEAARRHTTAAITTIGLRELVQT